MTRLKHPEMESVKDWRSVRKNEDHYMENSYNCFCFLVAINEYLIYILCNF